MDEKSPANRKVSSFVFMNQTRIVVLVLSLLCLTLCYSNTIALNFTLICMKDTIEQFHADKGANSSEIHWLESHDKVNWQFTAIAMGSLIGTIPIAHFLHYFGVRNIATLYGILSALSTLAIPIAVNSYEITFILRMIQGIPTALSYPVQGLITNKWAGTKESGLYIAIMSCHVQLCSILTMPLAGMLCESMFTWRAVYYVQAFITLVIFIIFFFFYRDTPEIHRNVSNKEVRKISIGKQFEDPNSKRRELPYRAILTDKCVLSIWLSTIGGTLGFYFFLTYGPIYLNTVLGLEVRMTGFATALPYILSGCNKFIVGFISDHLTIVSERTRVVVFASVSQGCMAFCYLMLGMITNPLSGQILYTAAIVFSGINVVGTLKCIQSHTGPFIHFSSAVIALLACGVEFLVPVAVWIAVPDNTPEQWHRVFIGIALIVFLASTPFFFFADAKPAYYTLTPAPSQITKIAPMEIAAFGTPNSHRKINCSELSYEDFEKAKSKEGKEEEANEITVY